MRNLGILEKVDRTLKESEFDAVLLTAPDNVRYLSGADLPFAPYRGGQPVLFFWSRTGSPVCLCPTEWEDIVRNTGWMKQVLTYSACGEDQKSLLGQITSLLEQVPAAAVVGLDMARVSYAFYQTLVHIRPDLGWDSCDNWMTMLRAQKTQQELALLEQAALMTDHGINGAIHHVTIDRRTSCLTLAEELRVHTEERGIPLYGYHASAHVAAGAEMKFHWSNPPKYGYSKTVDLHPGEAVRMKIQTCLNGYWADATRMMTMGELTDEQSDAYEMLVILRDTAIQAIKPGVLCSQVYEQVRAAAEANKIPLDTGMEVGHSIGVSPNEPPYLSPCDHTALQAGMILVIDPVVVDAAGQIWRSKDTVLVNANGCSLIGWYKNWREPYIPIASI